MRAKATFRNGKQGFRKRPHRPVYSAVDEHCIANESVQSLDDGVFSPCVANVLQKQRCDEYEELIRTWREHIVQVNKFSPWSDVRYTLIELLKLHDDVLTNQFIDERTNAQIATGAARFWKARNCSCYPSNFDKLSTYSPTDAREIIKHSLESMPDKNGRTSSASKDIAIGVELAVLWEKYTGRAPTVSNDEKNSYMYFCSDAFERIGRNIGSDRLRDILGKANQKILKKI